MKAKCVSFKLPSGLKSRAAAEFSQKANCFKSGIWIEKGSRRVNAKSLLGILSLAISCGDAVSVLADGEDEENAVDVLCGLLAEPEAG